MEGLNTLLVMWEFPKIRGTLFWVLIIRIRLFRVLYWGPLFSENPCSRSKACLSGLTLVLQGFLCRLQCVVACSQILHIADHQEHITPGIPTIVRACWKHSEHARNGFEANVVCFLLLASMPLVSEVALSVANPCLSVYMTVPVHIFLRLYAEPAYL